VTIDPTLAGRITAELQRRAEAWAEHDMRCREVFGDDWGPAEKNPFHVDLDRLPPQELAELAVDLLWPPGPEERQARALRHLDDVFNEETNGTN